MTDQTASGGVGDLVRIPKMAEIIASRLRRRIARGELKEGDVLPPEAALMEQFGVSRPSLREAFRILEAEALISVRRGARGGAQVHVPDGRVAARYTGLVLEYRGTTIKDVHDALLAIEPACVAMLAERRTKAQITQLKKALREANEVRDDAAALIRAQTDFHTLVVDLAANETLKVLSGMLRYIIDRANWSKFGDSPASAHHLGATQLGLRSHERLVELIEARDPDAAAALWSKHLSEAGKYFVGDNRDSQTILDLLE